MGDNVVDFSRARKEKKHDIKEQKLKKMRKRFSGALGLAEKPKVTKETTKEKMRLGRDPWDEE